MILKYNLNLSQAIVQNDIKRLINQVYKLLPTRQEGNDWEKPLKTIIEELVGMKRLFLGQQEESFLILLCKLEGLFEYSSLDTFADYRRTIFECLSLLGKMKEDV